MTEQELAGIVDRLHDAVWVANREQDKSERPRFDHGDVSALLAEVRRLRKAAALREQMFAGEAVEPVVPEPVKLRDPFEQVYETYTPAWQALAQTDSAGAIACAPKVEPERVTVEWLDAEIAWYEGHTSDPSRLPFYHCLCELRHLRGVLALREKMSTVDVPGEAVEPVVPEPVVLRDPLVTMYETCIPACQQELARTDGAPKWAYHDVEEFYREPAEPEPPVEGWVTHNVSTWAHGGRLWESTVRSKAI